MSTHVITAGHGYTYLTRHTMAGDGLTAYYSEQGEAPGRWLGRGLATLGVEPGRVVREEEMIALFGEGRHPLAGEIAARLHAQGHGDSAAAAATELGRPFALNAANSAYNRQVAQLAAEWNRVHGQPLSARVPVHVAAWVRTAVGETMFADEHGREPDARELADFVAQQSRRGSRAVAGFDLTFSPVKSVSALWALAPEAVAAEIEAAHHASVVDTMRWLERTAAFTRLGRNGVRQVETRGLIATAFVHRTSRAGDPDLHTHVAVSNKVQTLDGRWRALDGRVLFKATVAASERYNTRLEAELRHRLGISFVEQDRPDRRPVREVAGVDEQLLLAWSKRRAALDARRGELAKEFQAEHGRPPTPVEDLALAQQATLQTRGAKPAARSLGEQRAVWRAEAAGVLGEHAIPRMLDRALSPDRCTADEIDVDEIATRVVERVEVDRATWQRWHIEAEAQRVLRSAGAPLAQLDDLLARTVDTALSAYSIELTRPDPVREPEGLRRSDGSSVYSVAGAQMYSSAAMLKAERSVLAAANRFDGRAVAGPALDLALLEYTANGAPLNGGQAAFVRELATSGARCQVGLAPAGTGKTTALQALARAWAEEGGTLLTFAPSAAAARLLGEATGTRAETLAKGLQLLAAGDLRLDGSCLVVVDEAGMAATRDLARLVGHALDAGASVRLIGDDRQLAAVGAGGVLRDLAETAGAATLTTAVRFTDEREAAAALGVRDGNEDALDFYLDGNRVHAGDEHTAAESAYRGWRADVAAGRDSLLLAATREQVAALNTRARADRLGAADTPRGLEARLRDGTSASAGDPIVSRRNDRRLAITATDWVKNGDRWTVVSVLGTGDLRARHRDTGRLITLPASYVREHVALGYAVTIHAAQGRTADTCHTVIRGTESREQLYVALSRGRDANHVHVELPGAADEHALLRPATLRPPTTRDVLRHVLGHEDAACSASTVLRQQGDPERQLRHALDRYADAVACAPPGGERPAPAPLPWLPPVPRCTDPAWRQYLQARADQISELAAEITTRMYARGTRGSVLMRADPFWQAHNRLWAIGHPSDRDVTTLSDREYLYAYHLRQRLESIHGEPVLDPLRWRPLVEAIDPRLLNSAEYPSLASALTVAFQARLNVDALLPRLLTDGSAKDAVAELVKCTRAAVEQRDRADAERRLAPSPPPQVPRIGAATIDRGIGRGL